MSDRTPGEGKDPAMPAGDGGPSLMQRITGAGARVDWRSVVLVPLLAVVSALIIGALIIAMTDGPGKILDAYAALLEGSVGSVRAFSETLTAAAPLILAGLAVAIGFKAGLFNIGAEGQMLIGGLLAAIVGFTFTALPAVILLPLALLAGVVGGAIWGGIPGLLRAKTGAHEVITTIMFNWIAIRLLDYLLKTSYIQKSGRSDPISKDIVEAAQLPRLLTFLDSRYRVHAGVIVAVLAAWFVYWLLFKSTIGYEFRAVGLNPSAARYGEISVTRAYIAVMAVAGAAAGLAGANQVLGVLYRASPGFSASIGFDAIALALLGRSHPAGVVLAGLLFGALRAGGQQMQATGGVGIDLILVVQSLIIVFIAAPALIRAIYRVRPGEGAEQITQGWAT